MSGPNPRAAAVAALVRQEQDGFSNLILDAELKRQKLEGRDKAFASAIFYTVLEHQGTLDFILESSAPRWRRPAICRCLLRRRSMRPSS